MKAPASARIRTLESLLRERGFGRALRRLEPSRHPPAATGLAALDARLGGGLPRGAITELAGPVSSGRTGLLFSLLAEAAKRGEAAVYVDATDALDPHSAEAAGISLERLLWVRCDPRERPRYGARQASADSAWQAANLAAAAGGFGIVAVDLGGAPLRRLEEWRRRPWARLKQAVEHTPTALVVLAERRLAIGAAALALRFERERANWQGVEGVSLLLDGVTVALSIEARAASARSMRVA